MKLHAKRFSVGSRGRIDLAKWPTRIEPLYGDEAHYARLLQDYVKDLSRRQEILYASERAAVLVIFEAMDAGGKDSAIKHVMTGVNPQGCNVSSFAVPTDLELRHDFLWRCLREVPERGFIGIFNRSYYEEVLVARVHPERLRFEGMNASRRGIWHSRYRSILDMERHLTANSTLIVKIFLHISPEEQRKRLLERIDDPEKNWKMSTADIAERAHWSAYMKAYGKCLAATSTRHAPWFVVPADDKRNARLIVSEILIEAIKGLKLRLPKASQRRRRELSALRVRLSKKDSVPGGT